MRIGRRRFIKTLAIVQSDKTPKDELAHIRGAKVYTVGELTAYIKNLLDSDANLTEIWVRGEISNLTYHSSGHIYFNLKDERSQLQCVMFRRDNKSLGFTLESGQKVIAFGSISVYVTQGKYQLLVKDVQPDGLGALHLAFIQLKKRLEKEGLFTAEHKKPIPKYPKRIGLVTSPTGAAIRDVINVLGRRYPLADVLVAPVLVQGDGASASIVRAIQLMNQVPGVDVMIVGRGGGSLEDLWAFNEEIVARAIYDSRIPIISAVGHETDFTIADFVADVRAPTPSAAAEIAVPDKEELVKQIGSIEARLIRGVCRLIEMYRDRLCRIMGSPVFKRPLDRINQNKQSLDALTSRLCLSMSNNIKMREKCLEVLVGKLNALNPRAVLDRGYSITMKLPEEEIIKRVAEVEGGDKVKVVIRDGEMICQVENTKEVDKDG